jgi:flagellar motor switch protein FliN
MIDNQMTDLLTKAEQALNSILEPAADKQPRSVRSHSLDDFHDDAAPATSGEEHTSGNERLDLRIELGRTHISPGDVRQLRSGAVLSLDELAGELVDVYAGGRLVARGEAVVLDDRLGVRVMELVGL